MNIKKNKLVVIIYSFFFLCFTVVNITAQKAKLDKFGKISQQIDKETKKGTNKIQAIGDKVIIKDGTTILMEVEHEGSAGTIKLNDINGVGSNDNKLKNDGGNLIWGTEQLNAKTYSVGDFAQGGHIIEVSPDGKHGLVAALIDQSFGTSWYEANENLSNEVNHTQSGKAYKNWRLPTKRELNLFAIYQNEINATANTDGGLAFSIGFYWSSTESSSSGAWAQDIVHSDPQTVRTKSNSHFVRAVRDF